MIESMTCWLSMHADQAPLFIFGLLLLTGFSFPISEDVIVVASGVMAAKILPDKCVPIFLAVFFGTIFADFVAYWIGRLVGDRMLCSWIFRSESSMRKRKLIQKFFLRYGFLTLFVGRLIPFGIRNGIFMSAGALKVPFYTFVFADGISCLVISSALFYLGWIAGENYGNLDASLSSFGIVCGIFCIFVIAACVFWAYFGRKEKVKQS